MEFRSPVRAKVLLALTLAASIITTAFGVFNGGVPNAQAAQTVPYLINFQGRLTDNAGNALADGSYNVKFRLWSLASGGSNVWEGDRVFGASDNRIGVVNGLFNIQFGDTTKGDPVLSPTMFQSTSGPFLEVELPSPATATCASNGCASFTEGAMTPRQPLASSPYAFNSDTLDGFDSSAFGQLSANNTFTGANTFTPSSGVAITVQAAAATHSLDVKDSGGTTQAFFDATGVLNVAQTIQPTTTNTADIGLSGTTFRSGYFGTSIVTPAVNATASGGTITTNAGTLQRTAAGGFTIDLKNAANTALSVTNSGGGVAGISATGGLTIGSGQVVTVGAAAGAGVTCSSGQILDAITVNGGVVTGGTCIAAGGGDKLLSTWTSQQATTATNTQTTIQFTGAANSAPSFNNATHVLTLPSNASKLVIQTKAGGGGGGSVGATAVVKMAGGGGEGGLSQGTLTSLASNYYLVVGGGGPGGVAGGTNTGTGGSSTCFGTNNTNACTAATVSAAGGSGGVGSNSTAAVAGGAGGTSASGIGDLKLGGAPGGASSGASATALASGFGGGQGGGVALVGTAAAAAGNAGAAGGGGGGAAQGTAVATSRAGGAGGDGFVTIQVFVTTAGTGSPATLQSAYNNSSNPDIALTSLVGGLTVRDSAGGLGGNLFEVQDSTGATSYLAVTASGISTSGTSTAAGNINSTGGSVQTNSTTRIDNAGNLANIGTIGAAAALVSGVADTLAVTNSGASGANTVKGVAINVTGTNNGAGTNTTTGLDFGNVAAATNNTFTAENFGTGFTNLLTYNGSTVIVNGTGQINGAQMQSSTIANAALANSSITVTAGNGLTGGGSAALGGSTSLAVAYGSAANTAVQGNTTLVCPSGTGNLSGAGNTITLGTGGTCNSLSISNSPSFTTSVTSPVFTGTSAVGVSSGAGTALTLDSLTGNLVMGANTTAIQKSAAAFAIDLANAGTSTLTIKNSNGANLANLAITGALTIGASQAVTVGAATGQSSTVSCTAGQAVTSAVFTGGVLTTAPGCATISGTGATTTLNNLGTTSINADLLPNANNARSIGSASLVWANTFTGNLDAGTTTTALTVGTAATTTAVTIGRSGLQVSIPGGLSSSGAVTTSGNISATGTGTVTAAGNLNSTGGTVQTNSTDRITNTGGLTNITGYIQGSGTFSQTSITSSGNIFAVTDAALSTNLANLASLTFTNANASATATTVDGLHISPTGTTNANANANTLNAINLNGVTALTNNTFNGLNIGTGYTNYINAPNLVANSSGDLTGNITTLNGSTTTNGTGANSTSMTVTSSTNFDIGNYIQLANTAACQTGGPNTCYAKITNIVGNVLTITPALTWATARPVVEMHIPEIGGTDLTSTLANRYGRGYFISGVATGNGTTYYNEDGITTSLSSFNLLTDATLTTLSIGNAATSVAVPGSFTVAGQSIVNGSGQINGAQIQSGTIANGSLANSSITINGTGISGGGTVSLGGTFSLATVYGSTTNTAVQGSNTLICPSASGTNITGTGNTLTLGTSGGTCNAIGIVANPNFATSVTSPTINATTGFQIAGAATTGNYLRGNGTNFVSSALLSGDIPAGSGNYIQNAPGAQQTANFNIVSPLAGTTATFVQGATSNSVAVSIIKGGTTAAADLLEIQNSAGTNLVKVDQNGNLGVGLGVTAAAYPVDIVGKLHSTTGYILGTDLSLIPIGGSQSAISTWWGLELVGNRQANVDYVPSATGANNIASVIIPNQQAGSIGLLVRGQTAQTGDLTQWQDVSGNTLLRVSPAGVLGSTDSTAATTANVSIKSGDATAGTNLSSGSVTIDTGNHTGIGLTGAINIGTDTVNAKTITLGPTATNTNTTNIQIGINTAGAQNIDLGSTGSGAAAAGTTINLQGGTTASTAVVLGTNGAGGITIDTGTTGGINIGNNANAKTVQIGNTTAGTTLNLDAATFNVGDSATTKSIDIGGVTNSGNDTISIATNGTAADTITIGNNTAATAVAIDAGTTGKLQLGNTTAAHTIQIGAGGVAAGNTQNIDIGSNTTTTASAINLQAGNLTTTNNTATTGSGIIIGAGFTSDANLVGLTMDSYNTFAETANTCSNTANAGTIYYNSSSNAMRECVRDGINSAGNWEDMPSTAGLGAILFGVVPDSGLTANQGDWVGIGGANVGPCKVAWTSATSVTVQPCNAYSAGRKVVVATATVVAMPAMAVSQWVHVCFNASGVVVASAAGTETANIPAFSANNPTLCLADVFNSTTVANTIAKIYDLRTFTTTIKEFVTNQTALAGLGQTVVTMAAVNSVTQAPAATNGGIVRGVVVAQSAATSTTTITTIIAVKGPQWVKYQAIAGTINTYLQPLTGSVVGYVGSSATASTTAYGNLGLQLRVSDNATCTAATNCQMSVPTDINLR